MADHLTLPRSTPEAQGLPSRALEAFLDGVDAAQLELHGLMLLRHGHVVAEGWWAPYAPERIHLLYSLSKSFTSTAVGLAVGEGRLSVDDRVIDFFPEALPAVVSDNLAAMRVRHLLCMGTGHVEDTVGHMTSDADWIRGALGVPPEQAPGSIFTYNQGATFLLAAIVQKLTGQTLVDYLRPRLFDPLGIENVYWQQNPQGINFGYSGFHATTDAIARLGQLYLQRGLWQGKQLLSAEWIDAASARQIDSSTPGTAPEDAQNADWVQGYGYQFWRCRHNAYRGDGAFGQFCLIMPQQDAVLAITAGVQDMQAVLEQVWTHLLPAMVEGPLAEDVDAHAHLSDRLANLAYAPLSGRRSVPMADAVLNRTYQFPADAQPADNGAWPRLTAATVLPEPDGWTLVLDGESGLSRFRCGYGRWVEGRAAEVTPPGDASNATSGSGAWTADDTLTLHVKLIETPHALTYTCRFAGDTLELAARINVAFGPAEGPVLIGRAVD